MSGGKAVTREFVDNVARLDKIVLANGVLQPGTAPVWCDKARASAYPR